MNIKILGALSAVALLAACSTPTPPAPSPPPATSAGIVPGSEEDLVANVGDRVFFDFNRSMLRDDAKGTLDKQAAWLAKYGSVNVQIAGNCDERGTEEYNLALGNRRANAAASYLKAKGVAGARMTTISYGKDRPTAQGSTSKPGRRTGTRSPLSTRIGGGATCVGHDASSWSPPRAGPNARRRARFGSPPTLLPRMAVSGGWAGPSLGPNPRGRR